MSKVVISAILPLIALFVIIFLPFHASLGDSPCRAFRAKKQGVPVYREADRSSEVLGRLERSQPICGIAELKEFVTQIRPAVAAHLDHSNRMRAAVAARK